MLNISITKSIIDDIESIKPLNEKKEYLLTIIEQVEMSYPKLSTNKKIKFAQIKRRVQLCDTENKFNSILWNSLLSGEGLSSYKR
jgi:hypothetical protein